MNKLLTFLFAMFMMAISVKAQSLVANFSASQTNICAGTPVLFTDLSTGGPTIWQWDIDNNGTIDYTVKNPSHVYSAAGVYSVKLTVKKGNKTATHIKTNYITVNANLVPSLSISSSDGDNIICSGTNVIFTASPVNGGSTPAYQWRLNGLNVGTNSTSYSNNTLINGDAVSCLLTSNNICQTTNSAISNTITTTVNSIPATPGAIVGSSALCTGASASYSVPAVAGATTYSWSVPSGATINSGAGTNVINVTFGSSSGVVSVNAGNACGNSSNVTKVITISTTVPTTPGTITGPTEVCYGPTSQYYTINAVAGATSYSWNVPGGGLYSGQGSNAVSAWFGPVGSANVSVNASNACGTSANKNLLVNVNPIQTWAVTISSNDFDNIIVVGTNVIFTANSTVNGLPVMAGSYQWKINGINVGTNSTSYSTNTLANGDVVSCVATNYSTPCLNSPIANSNNITMTVTPSMMVKTGNIIENNDNQLGSDSKQSLGNSQVKGDIIVYPNPTSDILNIISNGNEIKAIEVFNLIGEKVMTVEKSNDMKINLSTQPNGIYFLNMISDSGENKMKVIKQ